MYIFLSGKTQSQKVMIVNREEVNVRYLPMVYQWYCVYYAVFGDKSLKVWVG